MTPLDQQCAHVQLLVRFCSRTTRLSRHVNPQTWNQCPRCHMDLPTQQIHLWCHWWKIHYHRARQNTLLVNQDKLSTTRHNHLMVSYPCLNCGSHLWETGLFFKSFLFTNQQKRGDGLPPSLIEAVVRTSTWRKDRDALRDMNGCRASWQVSSTRPTLGHGFRRAGQHRSQHHGAVRFCDWPVCIEFFWCCSC